MPTPKNRQLPDKYNSCNPIKVAERLAAEGNYSLLLKLGPDYYFSDKIAAGVAKFCDSEDITSLDLIFPENDLMVRRYPIGNSQLQALRELIYKCKYNKLERCFISIWDFLRGKNRDHRLESVFYDFILEDVAKYGNAQEAAHGDIELSLSPADSSANFNKPVPAVNDAKGSEIRGHSGCFPRWSCFRDATIDADSGRAGDRVAIPANMSTVNPAKSSI